MRTAKWRACVIGARRAMTTMVIVALLATIVPVTAAAQDAAVILISEIHYNPDGPDEAGEFLELHNPSADPVDIGGWALTRGVNFLIPAGVQVPPGGYVVVAADPAMINAGGASVLGPYEGSLANGGETLTLRTGADVIVEEFTWDDDPPWPIGADGEGASLQRRLGAADPAEAATWGAGPPTPGTVSDIAPAAAPVIAPLRGVHSAPITVTMTAPTPGSAIRFTLDGSTPTAQSPRYTAPVALAGNTTIRAAAFVGGEPSTIVTGTHLFTDDVIGQPAMDPQVTEGVRYRDRVGPSLLQAPSMHIMSAQGPVDPEYRPAVIEWLDPDGGPTFEIAAGWKIFGGKSIGDVKKNYRLKFSDEFGPDRLEFDFYNDHAVASHLGIVPVDGFDQLELRAGSGDSNLRAVSRNNALQMRNPMADDTMLAMGIPNPHNRYVHVYINHEYRGVYTLRERFDADFMSSYFGGPDDDYDAINKNVAFDGTSDRWNALMADPTWDTVRASLDTDALVDFMVYNFYNGTLDWNPNKNWAAAGPADPANPVGWLLFNKDHDNGFFRRSGIDTDITDQAGPGGLFGGLVAEAHPDFLQALRDSIGRNLVDGGPLTAGPVEERMDYRADLLEPLLVADSARWGTCGELCTRRDQPLWDPDDEWSTHLSWLRTQIIPGRTDVALDQLRGKGWYPVERPAINRTDVAAGGTVTISTRDGVGRILYTTDGSDPRLVGGAVSPRAVSNQNVSSVDVRIDEPTLITARVRRNSQWSSPMVWALDARAPAPMILNEWNAVAGSQRTNNPDPVLGLVDGNGGDWFELVVLDDHLDARGWTLKITNGGVPTDSLTLSDNPLWANLRAGTIITIAEDIADDVSYDPAGGDWTINVQVTGGGDPAFVSQEDFVVSANDWQLEIINEVGLSRFGPAGEGIRPIDRIADNQIGELESDPHGNIAPDSAYDSGNGSTFGAPNGFGGRTQNFYPLRSGALGVLPGDLNRSLSVERTDLELLLDVLIGIDHDIDVIAADVDANSSVNLRDAVVLAKQLLG